MSRARLLALACTGVVVCSACARARWTQGGAGDLQALPGELGDGTAERAAGDLPADSSTLDAPADRSSGDRPLSDKSLADKRATDKPVPDKPSPDKGCTVASASCWDVSAVFSRTDFEAASLKPRIFGQTVADGQKVYALFTAEDSTYSEPAMTCAGWGGVTAARARTWHIERKKTSSTVYHLLVRGISDADCSKGQPVNAGEIQVNAARGWKITQTVSCAVMSDVADQGQITTFCTVDGATGRIRWQAGSTCGGCCACPDGAHVGIDVVVSKS